MSRRSWSYAKGAARGTGYGARTAEEDARADEARATKSFVKSTHWHKVVKDGVVLSYGGDLAQAKKHAARCGGTVVSVAKKPGR